MTDERAAVELKGCALCGSTAKAFTRSEYKGEITWADGLGSPGPLYSTVHGVACDSCPLEVRGSSEARAIVKWNTRPIEDALRAENTELSARVSELTRLLAEAEEAICDLVMTCDGMRARFGGHHPCHAADRYDHVRQRLSVQRALQSSEGGKG